MRTRNTTYGRSVRNKIFRQLARSDVAGGVHNGCLASLCQGMPFKHVKLFRRSENCEMPADSNFLAVVSEMTDYGEWLPSHTLSAQTWAELTGQIRQLMANANGVVIEGSAQFEPLAIEMGLRHLTSEWGNL